MELKNYLCLLLIILSTLFSSCSLQKRHYRDGFYIESKSKEQTTNINKKDSSGVSPLDSVRKKIVVLNKNPKYKHDCDTLFLVDGTTLVCKIDEVTKRSVRFKNCTDSNEVSNSIDIELLSAIKFYNGREKTISKDKNNNSSNKVKENSNLIKGSLVETGLILAILAILFELILLLALFHVITISLYLIILCIVFNVLAAIIAIALGFRSLREIRKNPEIFKGKKMATLEIALGFISLVSWLIILIAITI